MLSILFDQNYHLHAGGGDVAELDGNAEALEDHCDSVLRVLDLTRGVLSKDFVLCVLFIKSYNHEKHRLNSFLFVRQKEKYTHQFSQPESL